MALDTKADTTNFDIARDFQLSDANLVAENRKRFVPSPAAIERCTDAHNRLRRTIAERRHVYGLTTGFGPLANRLIDPQDGQRLQQNLVHHLATGQGPSFDWATARAIVVARYISILQGVSGASPRTMAALQALLDSPFAPEIPERGTVGASGDLTPLAHMVLAFQGRGTFIDRDGTQFDGMDALATMDLPPLDLADRDGLALVNGTSAMTGIAVRNARIAERLVDWSLRLTGALAEVLGGRTEAWSPIFAELRPHPGQLRATAGLNTAVAGSNRLRQGHIASRQLDFSDFGAEPEIGQDAYTLRCAPQVIGGVIDVLYWHKDVAERELNAVTDNPIFPDAGEALAVHGGNFMGQHIALASDALATSIVVLAGLAERQIARLTDERLSPELPAFLHGGTAGLTSGFMGAQVTATALLGEMRSLGPASPHSISTNGANQDVVSMGTIAARHAARQSRDAAHILAILALGVSQAIDICCADGAEDDFSPAAMDLVGPVRALSPRLTEDRPLAVDIAKMAAHILESDPPVPTNA
ncbi:MAG: aromatic amino acid ammonia-lyase [Pseudomonadota bacterium]